MISNCKGVKPNCYRNSKLLFKYDNSSNIRKWEVYGYNVIVYLRMSQQKKRHGK